MITREQALAAFRRYDGGEHPGAHQEPKRWFVLGAASVLYPLKHVYSLATKLSLSEFHTDKAKREFIRLGFAVVDVSTLTSDSSEFEDNVAKSINSDDQKARRKRLSSALSSPRERFVLQKVFIRNKDVVAEVRSNAEGKCELCETLAPFKDKKYGLPYLEVHHKIPLAEGGQDTVENAIALCPNCHRKRHYG